MTTILVGHGFPFDVVESWSDTQRMAHYIQIGQQNGRVWDWREMQFRAPPSG